MTKDHCTPFRVPYSDITGDNNSALFLAQLEYWQGIKGNDWVAKSVTDWWNELRLSKKQVARIKAELESLGYIETCLLFFKGSQTTGYCFKKDAVQKALSDGFNAYDKDTIVPKGHDAKRAPSPKGTMPKGNYAPSPKVTMHSTQREPSITENTTENTTDILSDEKISSVPDSLVKTDFMKRALLEGIEKNEQAKPKSKKPKEPTDPLTSEIHKYTCEADAFLKQWYLDKYQTPLISYDKDFVNIKKTFRKLIDGSANLEEKKRLTPERCFLGVQYILENFDKLNDFDRKKISLNHIATNWSTLITTIQDYKAPVQKQNFNEPVAHTVVKKVHRDTFNGHWLPVGIGKYQFIDLAKLIAQDKIMNGELPDTFNPYDFTEYLLPTIKDYTPEQVKALLNEYDVK
jgi:hypothetical protein